MANSGDLLSNLGADAQALCRRNWWVFLLGGVGAVVFGLLALYEPLAAWLVVATFFAATILVDGVFNLIGALRHRDKDGWWIMLLLGALGAIVGSYGLMNPAVSMVAFIYLVAFEAVMLGVFTIMLGYKVRATTQREWFLYLIGGLSVAFGILVLANPVAAKGSIMRIMASWALIIGVLKIFFALRLRSLPERVAQARSA
jgi:uncharacterized membrane protein HdeD (DUF308 family)